MTTLSGKTALVTGSTSGIGLGIALSLAKAGANLILNGFGDASAVIAEVGQFGGKVGHHPADVSDPAQIADMIAYAEREFGGVDILVNNAGVSIHGKTVEEITGDEFRQTLETNLFGVFYSCHHAIPMMKQRGGGYIINISSLAGANPHPEMAAYNASKFGLNGFSEALMQEVRHDGIKVSYIMPGSVNTEFGGDEPSDQKSWQLQPDDIARLVMDLLAYPDRSLPSRVEIRPSRPPKK